MHCDCWNFLTLIHVSFPTPVDSIGSVRFSILNWNCRTMQLYYNRAMHDDDNVVWCDFCECNRKNKKKKLNFSELENTKWRTTTEFKVRSTCSMCDSIHRIFAFDQVLRIGKFTEWKKKKNKNRHTYRIANSLLNTTENDKEKEKKQWSEALRNWSEIESKTHYNREVPSTKNKSPSEWLCRQSDYFESSWNGEEFEIGRNPQTGLFRLTNMLAKL